MNPIQIVSLNISDHKGTAKIHKERIIITKNGIVGDAHFGLKNRQISMLGKNNAYRSIEQAANNNFGYFGENITIDVLPESIAILDRFVSDEVMLEVCQIGKQSRVGEATINKEGHLPQEGIFCRVLKAGTLKTADTFRYIPKVYSVKIITMSDRAFEGVYEDKSGKELIDQTEVFFALSKRKLNIEKIVLPDDSVLLTNKIKEYIDNEVDIIFTTGGTGIGPRDITPDVIKPFLEKELDGLMDFIRLKYGAVNYNAIISRSIAGVSKKTLIYCLPGSVKAVHEYFAEIKHTLFHSSNMINDIDKHSS